MSGFRDNITRLVKTLSAEEVQHTLPSLDAPYPILYLPSKQLVFQLVPIPTHSIDLGSQYVLQNLSFEARKLNLRFINIYEDFSYIKRQVVAQRISAILGEFTSIHARNTSVSRINKQTLDSFLQRNHLYNSPTARYKYGLFYKNELVAAASFSSGRPIERNGIIFRSFELVRFANISGHIVVGGVGKLLKHFIHEVKPDDVMSYADLDWSSGSSYEKLGFQLDGATPPQTFWINPEEKIRYYPHKLPLKLIAESREKNLPIEEVLALHSYYRFFNSGNLKYLLIP